MRTAGDYISLAKHGIGFTPDSRLNLWDLLNDAGRDLYALHEWWFRHRDGALSLVADQDYIDLPETWGGLIGASMTEGGAFSSLECVTLAEIVRLRNNNAGAGVASGCLYAYFGAAEGQVVVEDVPHARAMLYPTPATSEAGAISVSFLGLWKEIDEDDDNAVPNIPASHENLLVNLHRAHAISLENQSDPHENAGVKQQLAILIPENGRRQRTAGRLGGGADRFMRGRGGGDQRNFGSVTV